MRLLKLAMHLLNKEKLTFTLLAFQIIVSSLILIGMLGKIQNVYEAKGITETFNNKNAYYFMSYDDSLDNEFDIKEVIDKNPDISAKVGKIKDVKIQLNDNKEIMAYGYNDIIIDNANYVIENGNWFTDEKAKDNYIPVVGIGDSYLVGQEIICKRVINMKNADCL